MNERPVKVHLDKKPAVVAAAAMHDIARNIIMGGSSGQTAIVTTTTTATTNPGAALNGLSAAVANLETNNSSSSNSGGNSSNGIYHHAAAAAAASGSTTTTATGSAGSAFVNNNNNNNNNCLKRSSQVINKCTSASNSDAPHVTTMMTSGGDGCGVVVQAVSSSESAASSRSSSLSVSPNPHHHQSTAMLIHRTQGEEEGSGEHGECVGDSRKVEPLKINLARDREPIRTVIKLGGSPEAAPKITIKPIPAVNEPVTTTTSVAPLNEVDAIPRLHIRMNHHHAVEENISTTSSNSGTVVPKLTIKKMAPNNSSNLPVPRLTIKTNALGMAHAIGDAPNDHLHHHHHPTVPKLTIKVANEQTAADISPGSSAHTEPPTAEHSSTTASTSSSTASPNKKEKKKSLVPKLKVKLSRQPVPLEGDEEGEEEEDEEEEEEESSEEDERPPRIIPKLTIKPVPGGGGGGGGGVVEEVPKLVIKSSSSSSAVVVATPKGGEGGNNNGEVPNHHHHHLHHHHHHHHHRMGVEPLDVVCTSSSGVAGGGPQSPRIILKIHKNNQNNSIVSNTTEVGEEEENQVNNTQRRSKAEERIIAVIDLDDEESSRSAGESQQPQEKNGRPSRRLCGGDSDTNSLSGRRGEKEADAAAGGGAGDSRCHGEELSSSEEVLPSEVALRLQAPSTTSTTTTTTAEAASEGDMKTPVVKRGRGRPRKTPVVAPTTVGGGGGGDGATVPESGKKRGRKKKAEAADAESQVPATEPSSSNGECSVARSEEKSVYKASLVAAPSEDETGLPSPFTSSARKPRGGGRGGMGRTPSRRGAGGRGRGRGRGSTRKPFNKQQYFKQKTFEESIMNTYFEEDTRMSAADSSAANVKSAVSLSHHQQDALDSVSQSSHLSSASVTMDSTQTSSQQAAARKKLKMEVVGTMEGKTEFTVDMLAEYDWPQGVGCCPNKNRDTFMIQEQVAEYLGVKSFKRKYPDLERRTVEMEERDFLIERGLVTEKMCDLGVTAVYAVDVLDIMHQDFHDKYEQYKRFHREKLAKDISLRQKMNKAELGLGAREKAMRSVAKWNSTLNRTRKEDRRIHMDLQNFTIQVPEAKRRKMTYATPKPSLYPVALVVGQFSEYYKTYSPLELQSYPINTALVPPDDLMKRLLEEKMEKRREEERRAHREAAAAATATAKGTMEVVQVGEEEEEEEDEDGTAKSSSASSSSEDDTQDSDNDSVSISNDRSQHQSKCFPTTFQDSTSSESDCDVHDDDVCCVCAASQFTSPNNIPELFVKCAICAKMAHPSCIEMSSEMAKRAFQYQWQCVDCKRCHGCQKADDQQKMIYCQQCDRAYHIYCTKSLQSVPKGAWHCDICSICRKCGCKNPDGTNSKIPKQMATFASHRRPEWRHEYVKNEATGLKEHCGMLCVRCVAVATSPMSS